MSNITDHGGPSMRKFEILDTSQDMTEPDAIGRVAPTDLLNIRLP